MCRVGVGQVFFNTRLLFRHLNRPPGAPRPRALARLHLLHAPFLSTRLLSCVFPPHPHLHLLPQSPSSPAGFGWLAHFHQRSGAELRCAGAMAAAACADADADALAADIICSLRGADLAGWTPPWCKPAPREGELIWPTVARGKRSRRRSPSAGPAAAGKGRWGRGSPASPLDYSGGSGSGSGSGGSTSGGDDGGGFCSPGHRRAPATKVRGFARHPRTLPLCCFLCVRRRRAALGSSPSPTTSTLSLLSPVLFPSFLLPFSLFLVTVTKLPLLVGENPFPSVTRAPPPPSAFLLPYTFPSNPHFHSISTHSCRLPISQDFPFACCGRQVPAGPRLASRIRILIPPFTRNFTDFFSCVGFAKFDEENEFSSFFHGVRVLLLFAGG